MNYFEGDFFNLVYQEISFEEESKFLSNTNDLHGYSRKALEMAQGYNLFVKCCSILVGLISIFYIFFIIFQSHILFLFCLHHGSERNATSALYMCFTSSIIDSKDDFDIDVI